MCYNTQCWLSGPTHRHAALVAMHHAEGVIDKHVARGSQGGGEGGVIGRVARVEPRVFKQQHLR